MQDSAHHINTAVQSKASEIVVGDRVIAQFDEPYRGPRKNYWDEIDSATPVVRIEKAHERSDVLVISTEIHKTYVCKPDSDFLVAPRSVDSEINILSSLAGRKVHFAAPAHEQLSWDL